MKCVRVNVGPAEERWIYLTWLDLVPLLLFFQRIERIMDLNSEYLKTPAVLTSLSLSHACRNDLTFACADLDKLYHSLSRLNHHFYG